MLVGLATDIVVIRLEGTGFATRFNKVDVLRETELQGSARCLSIQEKGCVMLLLQKRKGKAAPFP
eukprot:8408704-Pyramimonas_sp.AAC.1